MNAGGKEKDKEPGYNDTGDGWIKHGLLLNFLQNAERVIFKTFASFDSD